MQQRSTPKRTSLLWLSISLTATLTAGCASGTSGSAGSGGKSGTGSGGSNSTSSGGSNGTSSGGSNGTSSGGSNGTSSGGSNGTSSGGSNGTSSGGSNGTSSGGSNGTGTGGSNGTGTGGSNTGTGGTGTTGTGGAGGASTRACAAASADVISDFEEGQGVLVKQGTPARNGWWYTYYPGSPAAIMGGMMQTPARSDGPIAVAASGDTAMCNKFALHSTGSGFGGTTNNYAGFGAAFVPMPAPSQIKNPYDVSAYTGISFKIKSGSGTPPAVYFEILAKENQPSTSGGTATTTTIDLYNTRGHMLTPPWIPTAISTSWQTIYVPFGALIPRWVPAVGASMACPAAGASVPRCQASKFNPANVLGLQFSMYTDAGFPRPSGSTLGTYDLWVDDVQFVKGDMGLPTITGFPKDGSVGMCTKPTGATGKYLTTAYNLWKQTFVSGNKVIRPENGNDTVSEGIAYGMFIAVSMNDQTLFDSLYGYWKNNAGAGSLMTWCIPAGGNSCQAQGGGSATDADEDAALALLMAAKAWGGLYKASAMTMIGDIWTKDIDATSHLPTGGSNYGSTSSKVTNPSYFSPAAYKAFMAAGDTHDWAGVISAVYGVIGGSLSGTKGLFPAWCTNDCKGLGSNGGTNDMIYQYDSHRIPMRIGLDYCWNGTMAAKTYTDKTTAFFATDTNAGKDGVGRIADLYKLDGTWATGSGPNSASIIGTAAVGAMASAGSSAANKAFLDEAYQAVFDMVNRGTLAVTDNAGKTPYSYYNATVGLLTALMMTGNFQAP